MTIYLDCNATSPLDPEVRDIVWFYMTEEFGNAGSRTHEFGMRAKKAVQKARDQVARVVDAQRDEVIFTSGATESNNLAILGLREHGHQTGKHHIISTRTEHKAVLEPLEALEKDGFTIDFLDVPGTGLIDPKELKAKLREDTLLVTIMHANNETGVIQPIEAICEVLGDHPAFLHTDAAQSYGKLLAPLRETRIDMISVSGHKVYAPKGIGALITRKRGFKRPPLKPLMYGGGQERGLRPGTLAVPLIAGMGIGAEIAIRDHKKRESYCLRFREKTLNSFARLNPVFNGDQDNILAHVVNLTFPGLDSEAVMLSLKNMIAISNGSACTSQSYDPSHVLLAMKLPEDQVHGALRLSWCHLSEVPDWATVVASIQALR